MNNIFSELILPKDSSGPQIEELGEESDFPVDPIWIVSIVLIIGLGSSAAFMLNQRSKGAFGGSGEKTEDFNGKSDKSWNGRCSLASNDTNSSSSCCSSTSCTSPTTSSSSCCSSGVAPPPQPQAPPAAAPPVASPP